MGRDRLLLFRPLTRELLHSEVPWKTGSDNRTLSSPGDVTFTLPPSWASKKATDGAPMILDRGTLAVVERPNRTIRNVALVDSPPVLTGTDLTVSCGGLSMLPGQSGPWEGHQGYYVNQDPLVLFRTIIAQTQAYANADVGLRVVGDTRTGASVGTEGSARYQEARRAYYRYKPELDKWEGRNLTRERIMAQRTEELFRAVGLKRVGNVSFSDSEPEDPGYQADSTIWVREATGRAYVWRGGRWVSQSQADEAVARYISYQGTVQAGKDELQRLQYLAEPAKELMDEYEEREGREEYSLYFWQNHDLNSVIEDLLEIGPFEYREEAAWNGDDLDLMLRVGAPTVGVRREELHLELGVNVHEQPEITAPGDSYTGVALFGAGEGSEVLSAQRDWNPAHMVRRILTETDKDAHTKQLTRAAADRLAKETRADMQAGFTDLVIQHGKACPEGSFNVGDILPVTGTLPDGSKETQYARVLDARNEWGSNETSVELEMVW